MCIATCCAASSFPNGVLIIHPHSGHVNDVSSSLLIRPPPEQCSGLIGYCYVYLIKYLEDVAIIKMSQHRSILDIFQKFQIAINSPE